MSQNGVQLGKTGVTVSRLAFGTVFMGPQGDDISAAAGAELLLYALEQGIYFWDTADEYGSHPHIAQALRQIPRDRVVICSKLDLPVKPVEHVLEDLDTDYLDILLVHDVSLQDTQDARDTIKSWQSNKRRGKIRALGLSTHYAEVARLAAEWPEVEVLMLPINSTGVCLPDYPIVGGIENMKAAAAKAWDAGKGIIAMKVMGCGVLTDDPAAAISHVANLPYVHSLCIGMRSRDEIDQNVEHLSTSLGQ
jgi:aryl-alcohol dehydrogenase-like predicted oxidoreductase